jgi:hypothetical protein
MAETVLGDRTSLMPVVTLSTTLLADGRADDGLPVLEASLAAFQAHEGTDYERANVMAVIGIFHVAAGAPREGRGPAEESLRLARRIGNPSQLAISLATLGLVLVIDEPATAIPLLEESLALTAAGASDVMWSMAQTGLGTASAALGDRRRALDSVRNAIVHSLAQGNVPSIAFALATGLSPLLEDLSPELVLLTVGLFRAQGWWVQQGPLYEWIADRQSAASDPPHHAALRAQIEAMSFDDGVHRVLEELDREIARLDD